MRDYFCVQQTLFHCNSPDTTHNFSYCTTDSILQIYLRYLSLPENMARLHCISLYPSISFHSPRICIPFFACKNYLIKSSFSWNYSFLSSPPSSLLSHPLQSLFSLLQYNSVSPRFAATGLSYPAIRT